MTEPDTLPEIDLSKPRYDQSTYSGRARHFIETASPLNALVSRKRLEEAARLVKSYKYVTVIYTKCTMCEWLTFATGRGVHQQEQQ